MQRVAAQAKAQQDRIVVLLQQRNLPLQLLAQPVRIFMQPSVDPDDGHLRTGALHSALDLVLQHLAGQ